MWGSIKVTTKGLCPIYKALHYVAGGWRLVGGGRGRGTWPRKLLLGRLQHESMAVRTRCLRQRNASVWQVQLHIYIYTHAYTSASSSLATGLERFNFSLTLVEEAFFSMF